MTPAVKIIVSDPWEFATVCNATQVLGWVKELEPEKMLIDLARPIAFQGRNLCTVTATPRHVGVRFAKLEVPVAANMIFSGSVAEQNDVVGVGTVTISNSIDTT